MFGEKKMTLGEFAGKHPTTMVALGSAGLLGTATVTKDPITPLVGVVGGAGTLMHLMRETTDRDIAEWKRDIGRLAKSEIKQLRKKISTMKTGIKKLKDVV